MKNKPKFSWRDDVAALSGSDLEQRRKAAGRLRHAPDAAFDMLSNLVLQKAFVERDPVECLSILRALKGVNAIRAIGVFYELAARTGLVSAKTRAVAEMASSLLEDVDEGTPTPGEVAAMEETNIDTLPPTRRPTAPLPSPPGFNLPSKKQVEMPTGRIDASTIRKELEAPPVPRTTLRYTEEEASAAIAWLRCPPFDAVPIGLRDLFQIGRSDKADLVLSHPSVSRVHVVVRVWGQKMQLEDRSTYGTWVNGERTMTHTLEIGDTITIGPYDVTVEADVAKPDDGEDTRPLRTFASSEAIGGRIERVSLAEVLQQMEFNQKTGTLSVFSDDGHKGTLVVYDGAPMYAEYGEDLKDNQAVIAMLNLVKGNFSFVNKIEAGEMTMQGTLTGILLEASRQIDEGD